MSKCVKCKSRKGKRYCPALSGLICPLCCGKYREKEIECPESCMYLVKHRTYQEKKEWLKNIAKPEFIEKKQDEIYKDKKFTWFAYNVEKTIVDFILSNPNTNLNDRKVIKALEYVLDKIKQQKRLIYFNEADLKRKDDLGELIYNTIKNIRYPTEIVVPKSMEFYPDEEKIKYIENLIFAVKLYSEGELDGKNYINSMKERIKKLVEKSKGEKIIIPR